MGEKQDSGPAGSGGDGRGESDRADPERYERPENAEYAAAKARRNELEDIAFDYVN